MAADKIQQMKLDATEAFRAAATAQELYEHKVKFLGKSGLVTELMKLMAGLSKEEKPEFGKKVNELKQALEQVYVERESLLKDQELAQQLSQETLDLSLPGPSRPMGSQHPISLVISEIVEIFARMGYAVRTGPLIEMDRYNFEALNIPADHPARDMQDTFYVDQTHVLRTHTSPIQIRAMEQAIKSKSLPIRILAPGSVFRCDSDVSHSPNFHQIEGLLVDKKVSMADLKGSIAFFAKEFFGAQTKVRLRPSFFPFTEPSAEIDCSCPICDGKGCRMCSHTGWVEIAGCGLVNPKVFEHCGIGYPEWQGFAFGLGIERMAIIKYGVSDIRLFSENDIRFLRQFAP